MLLSEIQVSASPSVPMFHMISRPIVIQLSFQIRSGDLPPYYARAIIGFMHRSWTLKYGN